MPKTEVKYDLNVGNCATVNLSEITYHIWGLIWVNIGSMWVKGWVTCWVRAFCILSHVSQVSHVSHVVFMSRFEIWGPLSFVGQVNGYWPNGATQGLWVSWDPCTIGLTVLIAPFTQISDI